MIYCYRGVKIFYKFINRNKQTTNIYLHGWGTDMSSLLFCEEYFNEQNSLYVDFPPFGRSGKNIGEWSVFTYANMIISLCEHLKIETFNLIGHSFGGRIAIIVATLCIKQAKQLILIDNAGVKPKRSFCYYIKIARYKIRKRFGLDISRFGSEDYKRLSTEHRKVFINIVSTHLDDFLPLIKAKTLIVFGKNDTTTPIYMAKRCKKLIKDSQLQILDDAGHFCFDDKRIEFVTTLRNFLK